MMFMIVLQPQSGPVVKERVDAAIKTLGNYSSRMTDTNVWMLESSTRGARAIRDHLKQFIEAEKGDRLFVARFSRNWAGTNMGPGFPEWMQRREFGDFPNG
jgi:hypothetical protein